MPLKGENNAVESLYDAAFGRLSWDEVGRNLVRTLDGLTLMLSVHSRRTPAVDVHAGHVLRASAVVQRALCAP
jgi:hypothetical protein